MNTLINSIYVTNALPKRKTGQRKLSYFLRRERCSKLGRCKHRPSCTRLRLWRTMKVISVSVLKAMLKGIVLRRRHLLIYKFIGYIDYAKMPYNCIRINLGITYYKIRAVSCASASVQSRTKRIKRHFLIIRHERNKKISSISLDAYQ